MRLPLIALLTVTAMGPPAGADSSGIKPTLPPAVATRQNLFAIPFRVERADVPAHEPVEVQLHVSGDRGAHWQLYSRVEPARQRFLFRAGGDGEYWFLVRTLDRSGQLRPEGFTAPGLRVVVDTAPPKLQLSAFRGQDGQFTVRWRIEEPNPRPDTLRIEFRTTDSAPWQPVALSRQGPTAAGPIQEGEVTWWPQASSGEVQVRAEVSDAAGNSSVSQARLKLDDAAGTRLAQPAAESSPPWRGGTDGPPASNWPADRKATTPFGENRSGAAIYDARSSDDADTAKSGGDKPGDKRPPDRRSTSGRKAAAGPSTQRSARAPAMTSDNGPAATGSPAGPVAAGVNPAIQDRYIPPDRQISIPGAAGLPPGERPRMVNSRLFELEYDIESAGAARGARVELWGSNDGGRTWKSYAADSDDHGRLRVAVDKEGIYGFRIAMQGGGTGGTPPLSGDLPEVWIGIDLSKPTARITSAQQGSGTELGKLIIYWEATDNLLLTTSPVALFFSEALGRPWTTIAAGLENTGRYAWPIDNRLPERVFLRLEVRDEAGNLGVFESSEPITLDRSHPAVRIRDVRPLGQSAGTNPKR
jgi:hypothetical protein